MRESIKSKESSPLADQPVVIPSVNVVPVSSSRDDSAVESPSLERLESHESALDAFFANLPQGAPHIKVQRITK